MSDVEMTLNGGETPRVMKQWPVIIGEDQLDHLEDLAKEARDRGWDPTATPMGLLRAALDDWIPSEYRRRVDRDDEERRAQADAIQRQIESLTDQLRALRGEGVWSAVNTGAVIVGSVAEPYPPPLQLPQKRSRPRGSVRQHATRDVLAALKGRGWTYEAEIARMVYGSPGTRNEARARKRLRALELAGVVEVRKTESAEGHGFPWRLKREVVEG